MNWYLGSMELIIGALLIAALVFSYFPRFARRGNLKLSASWGFDSTERMPAEIQRSLSLIRRGTLIGLGIGLAAGFVAVSIVRAPDASGLFAAYGWGAVGYASGVVVSGIVVEATRTRGQLRLAHSRAVGMTDYLPVLYRVLAWAVAGLCVLQIAVGAILGAAYRFPYPGDIAYFHQYFLTSSWMTAGGLAALVMFEFAGRALIQRGQSASSIAELVWADGLRGHVLRLMLGAPLFVTAYAILQSYFLIEFTGAPSWLRIVSHVVVGAALIAIAIGGLAVQRRGAARQYLRRLWPERAAMYDARVDADYRERYLAKFGSEAHPS